MRLEAGQVAVVTGGASGIGLALAREFASRGLDVVIGDVEEPTLDLALDAVGAFGTEAIGVPTDVSDLSQVENLANRTLERFGRVDVICNNAGVFASVGPMWELDRTDWEWTIGVNLWGVVNGITTFVPILVERGEGHVVNTSSMAGIATVAFLGPYTAAKHAVVGLSESLAVELAHSAPKVGVTVLCPGLIDTRIGEAGRNRPANLRPKAAAPNVDPEPPDPELVAQRTEQVVRDVSMISPEEVAVEALTAIETGQLHVATAHLAAEMVRKRTDVLLADVAERPDTAP
ncbi:MAG TPA: SDR family NAD(P)-dependent oxidoreductase [Acidimicrobiales bacterium]|nr:SDR family NAD(P)-dependent oxidoreductase [Acidimicrobiales bacterium]